MEIPGLTGTQEYYPYVYFHLNLDFFGCYQTLRKSKEFIIILSFKPLNQNIL